MTAIVFAGEPANLIYGGVGRLASGVGVSLGKFFVRQVGERWLGLVWPPSIRIDLNNSLHP